MAAKIKEVAKRSGLSTATVSRILNGKGGHSATAVKTVEKIMTEMGYNSGLWSNVPESIGIIMLSYRDFIANDYGAVLLSSIMEMLSAEGLVGQIIPVTAGRISYHYIRSIVERYGLKGLIIQEFDQLYTLSAQLNELSIPVVSIGNTEDAHIRNVVCCDNYQGGYDAASFLWSQGHRRFGILSMRSSDICQRLRLDGFSAFLRENGGIPDEIWVREFFGIQDSVTAGVAELVNMEERPTAILSTNSSMAHKFMIDLRKTSLRIPHDLSLISFEERGELAYLDIPVTAITQPTRIMGEAAVKMLINLIRNHNVSTPQVLSCNLEVRATTTPIKSINQSK